MIAAGDPSFPVTDPGESGNQAHALRLEIDLFAFPPRLRRLSRLLSVTPVNLKSLGDEIGADPGLASEALRLCNSSVFGLPHPIARLEEAVIIMGADVPRTLLSACWLIKYTAGKVPAGESHRFWHHSLLVAQLSRHLAEAAGYAQTEWAFLAGLLHDVGILPFLTMLSRKDAGKKGDAFNTVGDTIEPQRRRFGIDHGELGLRMAFRFDLPRSLVEVAARHHQRAASLSGSPLLSLVAAGEVISQDAASSQDAEKPSVSRSQLIRNAVGELFCETGRLPEPALFETLESDMAAAPGTRPEMAGSAWEVAGASCPLDERSGGPPCFRVES